LAVRLRLGFFSLPGNSLLPVASVLVVRLLLLVRRWLGFVAIGCPCRLFCEKEKAEKADFSANLIACGYGVVGWLLLVRGCWWTNLTQVLSFCGRGRFGWSRSEPSEGGTCALSHIFGVSGIHNFGGGNLVFLATPSPLTQLFLGSDGSSICIRLFFVYIFFFIIPT
jgi:hypothetical protein